MNNIFCFLHESQPLETVKIESCFFRVELNNNDKWFVIADYCYDYKSALKKARYDRNKYSLQTRVVAVKEITTTTFQQEIVETYNPEKSIDGKDIN